MSLTKQQIQDYIDNEGEHCPYCESDHGISEHCGFVTCLNPRCKKEWTNVLRIVGIENV